MAVFYLDLVNGNDASAGTSWGTAWKTFANGPTAARIAPGDEIRVAKTSDEELLGTCTWTDNSTDVTIPSGAIKAIDDAVGNTWSVSTNVTGGTSTNRKLGATSQQLTVATAFTTGKIAYKAISGGGTQDFSAYTRISLWFYNSAVAASGVFSIRLCSDASGNTAVNTLLLPALPAGGAFFSFSISAGGALGSNIQSVALYAESDPGAVTIRLNNIFATTKIDLASVMGTSGAVYYPIMNVTGTTAAIDYNSLTAAGKVYRGTTAAVATYVRRSITTTETSMSPSETGGVNALNLLSGGWDTATDTQNGLTAMQGFSMSSNAACWVLEKFFFLRPGQFTLDAGTLVRDCIFCNGGTALSSFNPGMLSVLNDCIFSHFSGSATTSTNGENRRYKFERCSFLNSTVGAVVHLYDYVKCAFHNNSTTHIHANTAQKGQLRKCSFSYPSRAIGDTFILFPTNSVAQVSLKDADADGNNEVWSRGVYCRWQSTTKQGSDPGAWQVEFHATGGTERGLYNPFNLEIAQVACASGAAVTVTAWVKKNHATNVGALIFVESDVLNGVTETQDAKADDTSWEQLSISFTPTQAGVIPVFLRAWVGAAIDSVFVGSITVTQ